jgi:hypothetical protein
VGSFGKTNCINAINVEWKGEKSKKSINVEGGFFLWRVECFKIGKRDFTFIREMRVLNSVLFGGLLIEKYLY